MSESLRGRSVRAVGWSALQGWGTQLVGLLVFTLLARLLTPEDFGLLAMATIAIALANLLIEKGISLSLVQQRELDEADLDTAFWLNLAASTLLAALAWMLAPLIATLFDQPRLESIVRWLCLVLPLKSGVAVQIALLRRDLDYRSLAVRGFAAIAAGGLAGVSLAVAGYGVWALVAQQLVNAIVTSIALWHFCPWRPSARFSMASIRRMYRFGLSVMGINLAEFVSRQGDNFIIGLYLGPTALGYYNLAYRLFTIIAALVTGMTAQVSFPVFASLQDDIERLRRAFLVAVKFSALLAIPAFVGLCIMAPVLVPMMLDARWLPSVPVVQVLALVGLLEALLQFNAQVMLALDKAHWRLALNLVSSSLNVIGFLFAVHYGIVAVAIIYVVRGYLLAPVSLMLVRRLTGLRLSEYAAQVLPPLVASLAMAAAIIGLRFVVSGTLSELATLLVCLLGGALVYAGAVAAVAPATVRDLLRSLGHLRRRRGPV